MFASSFWSISLLSPEDAGSFGKSTRDVHAILGPQQMRRKTMASGVLQRPHSHDAEPSKDSSEPILEPVRLRVDERTWSSPSVTTDYGFHWDNDGEPTDLVLVDKVVALFSSLKFKNFDAEMHPSMSKASKDFLTARSRDCDLWGEAGAFLQLAKPQDIAQSDMSFRQLSIFVQSWLAGGSTKGRAYVVAQLQAMLPDTKC